MKRQTRGLIIVSLLICTGGAVKIFSSGSESADVQIEDKVTNVMPKGEPQQDLAETIDQSTAAEQSSPTFESVEVTDQPTPAKSFPDYYADLPPVEDAAASFESLDDQTVEVKLEAITQTLASNKWIERANQGVLSLEQRRKLASILHTESALRLSRILRKLNQAEDEIL